MYLNVSLPCISMKSKCVITGKKTSICFNHQLLVPPFPSQHKNHGASFQGLSLSALGVPSNCLEVTGRLQKLYLQWPGMKPTMWNQPSNVHIQKLTFWTPIWGWFGSMKHPAFPFGGELSGEPWSFFGSVPKKWGNLQMGFCLLLRPPVWYFFPLEVTKLIILVHLFGEKTLKGWDIHQPYSGFAGCSSKKEYADIFQPLISTEKTPKSNKQTKTQKTHTHTQTAAQKPHPMRASGWYHGLS